MKYGDMNEEQKTAYKLKQGANQQLARDRAKTNTINYTITGLTDEQFKSLISIMENK